MDEISFHRRESELPARTQFDGHSHSGDCHSCASTPLHARAGAGRESIALELAPNFVSRAAEASLQSPKQFVLLSLHVGQVVVREVRVLFALALPFTSFQLPLNLSLSIQEIRYRAIGRMS